MSNQYAEWAINLPNQFAPLGEVMSHGLAMQQRRNEQLMKLKQEGLKQQQDDTNANLKYLNDKTEDVEKQTTGINAINTRTHDEINKIFQKYKDLAKTTSPDQYQGQLMQDLLETSKWHQGAVTAYNDMVAKMPEVLKQYSNMDVSALKNIGMNKIAKTFIDPNGEPVKSDLIHNVNPFEDLNDPEVLAGAVNNTSPLTDYLEKGATTDVNQKYRVDKNGKTLVNDFKGKINPVFRDLSGEPDAQGIRKGFPDLTYKPMTQEMFDQNIVDTPDKKASFYALYLPYKRQIEQSSSFPFAFKEGTPHDAQLKLQFASELVKKHDKSILNPDTESKTSSLLNRIELGYPPTSGSGAASNVNDVYKTIDDKVNEFTSQGYPSVRVNALNADAQTVIADFVNKATGGTKLNYKNMFLYKSDDGSIGVYKKRADGQLDHAKEYLITTLPEVGTNLKVQPGAPEKRAVIAEGNHSTPPPHTKKKTADELGIN